MTGLLRGAALALVLAVGSTAQAADREPVEPVKDEGFTSPVHGAHAGEILFSKKPVPRAPTSDADFGTSFQLTDKIYLRPFLKRSLENDLRATGWQCYKDRIRGMKVQVGDAPEKEWVTIEWKGTHENNFDDWLSWSLASDGKRYLTEGKLVWTPKSGDYRWDFATEVVPLLKEGDNQLTFHVVGHCYAKGDGYEMQDWTAASSTITLTVPKGGKEAYWKKVGPFLPKHALKGGKKLVAPMKKTVAEEWPSEDVLAAVTTSEEWHVALNRYHGKPEHRTVSAVVVVRKKGEERCRAFDLSFRQQYTGSGKKFHKAMSLLVGSSKDFPCVNAR